MHSAGPGRFLEPRSGRIFPVCAIDPGRRHIFTAAYGCDEQEHEIRRVSRSEYSNMIGAKQRTKRLQKRKK